MHAAANSLATLFAVCAALGLPRFALAQQAARPTAPTPIVLSYTEAPIFLGPHEHNVNAIAFSPDGKTIATGSGDSCLRFWDLATGKLKSIHAEDATRGIGSLAYSPDGARVAVVGSLFGNEAVVWDVASGRIVQALADHPDPNARVGDPFIYKGKPIVYRVLEAIAFSPDGRLLATAPDGVVLRDAESGRTVAAFKPPAKAVKQLAFAPDGKSLATADDDKKVRLWSVPEGALQATLAGPAQPLAAVAFSPDGTRVVAAARGNRSILDQTPVGHLFVWERAGGPPRKIELGNVAVRRLAFAGPNTVVVGAGREVLSFDLSTAETPHPHKIAAHSRDVMAVAVSPDGRLVASGGADRTVDVVELATGKLVQRLPGLMDIVSSVAVSSDGRQFGSATIDTRFSNRMAIPEGYFATRYETYFAGEANADRIQPSEVRITSTADGRVQALLPLPACQVTAIDYVPGADQLVVAGWVPGQGGMLALWDTSTLKHLRDLGTHAAEVQCVAIASDGKTLASGDAAGNVEHWDLQSGTRAHSHKHDHPVVALAFSADGKLLAVGNNERTVQIVDAATGKVTRTLHARSRFKTLDFSPDAKLLAVGLRTAGIQLFELGADGPPRFLKSPLDPDQPEESKYGFVAFSPDGRFVVCSGLGKDIAVFEVPSGKLHKEMGGHAHPATTVTFLPDGRLISGGEERTVRLWDPTAGKLLATWVFVPADAKQNWSDQWVGYTPAGKFVGSKQLDRLVGWETGGDVILGQEDARKQRVESLFEAGRVRRSD